MLTNIVAHNARVVRASIAVVDRVQPADLTAPTPCAEWNLAELLAHLTAQHRGFAAAANGNGADLPLWQARPLGPDPVAEYRKAADAVLAAFAQQGVLEREFAIPEVSPDGAFPAEIAIAMHTVDYLVHAWDVARTIDVAFNADLDAVRAVAPLAAMVPDGPQRLEPGSAFGPAVPAANGAGEFETMLAALGRDPNWSREAG